MSYVLFNPSTGLFWENAKTISKAKKYKSFENAEKRLKDLKAKGNGFIVQPINDDEKPAFIQLSFLN